jgi:hypothetical protein
MSPFDGTMAYAQNKRQQVSLKVLTNYIGIDFTKLHFGRKLLG